MAPGYQFVNKKKHIVNKYKYKSKNANFDKELPSISDNDIVILEYDSNQHTLSFRKNQNQDIQDQLDSVISNLPQNYHGY